MDEHEFLCRHIRPEYPQLRVGSGTRVADVNGKEYLDFASQTLNLSLGQFHPEVVERVRAQSERIQYTSSKYSDPTSLSFAERLVEVAPEGLTRVNHKMTGGSLANECGIKMARRRHDGDVVATPAGSFFGETVATMQCSSNYRGSDLFPSSETVVHVDPPRAGVDAGSVEEVIDGWKRVFEERRDDLCAVLTTPLEVNAGLAIEPDEQGLYLGTLRDLCDDNDVALIVDEAQTALGWLEAPFAVEQFGVTPDVLTVSKAIAAGFPLGATLCREEYDNLEYGEHEFTNGAHPVSCAAGLATLSVTTDEELRSEIQQKGAYMGRRLVALEDEYDTIRDVRQVGLVAGIEVATGTSGPAGAERVFNECMDRGVLFRVSGDFRGSTVVAKPPVIISRSEIDRAVDTLRSALDALEN